MLLNFNIFVGEQSSSNAFLSPQWGGIMIYNLHRTAPMNATSPEKIAVDMKPVMNIFLTQLKLLLGVLPVVRIQVRFHCFDRSVLPTLKIFGGKMAF